MMKKNLQLLCLFVCMTFAGMAQMKEGKVTYDMVFSSDNPDMAMAVGMMQGSKMIMAFMPGKSRSEVSMGTMGTMVTIADEKAKKALMLMDMMGMKYAMEIDPTKQEAEADKPAYKVEITNETKTIMGYKCTKAILTSEDAGVVIVWFTKDIAAYTQGQSYYNADMPGFPLAFTVNQNEMTIDLTATTIEKKVDKGTFDLTVPEGYEVKTQEELMMMGQ